MKTIVLHNGEKDCTKQSKTKERKNKTKSTKLKHTSISSLLDVVVVVAVCISLFIFFFLKLCFDVRFEVKVVAPIQYNCKLNRCLFLIIFMSFYSA